MKFNVALLAILPLTLAAPVLEPKGPDTTNGLGGDVSGLTGAAGNALGGLADGKAGLLGGKIIPGILKERQDAGALGGLTGDLGNTLGGLTGGKRGISEPALSSADSNTNHIAGLVNLDDLRVPVHIPVNVEIEDNKILKRGISDPALSSANSNTNHIAEVDVSNFP